MDHPSALVDATVLQTLHDYQVQGEPDPAAEVAQAFLDVMPERLAHLRAAAQRGDLVEVHNIAHQIRGSCAAVGAVAMHATASALEAATTAEPLPALVDQLEALFTRTRTVLESR